MKNCPNEKLFPGSAKICQDAVGINVSLSFARAVRHQEAPTSTEFFFWRCSQNFWKPKFLKKGNQKQKFGRNSFGVSFRYGRDPCFFQKKIDFGISKCLLNGISPGFPKICVRCHESLLYVLGNSSPTRLAFTRSRSCSLSRTCQPYSRRKS